MSSRRPKTLLKWNEPRPVRAARRSADRVTLGPGAYLRARLRVVLILGVQFLLLAMLPYFVGKPALALAPSLALPVFASILLAYFISGVIRLMPQGARITDQGVEQQVGTRTRAFRWDQIARAEIVDWRRDFQTARLLVLWPAPPQQDATPAVLGVPEEVEADELERVLTAQGAAVGRPAPEESEACQAFVQAVERAEAADPAPFRRIDAAFGFLFLVACTVLVLTWPDRKVDGSGPDASRGGSPGTSRQGTAAPDPSDRASARGPVYADPAGYRLQAPAGWQVRDRGARNELIRADLSSGSNAGVQVRLLACPPEAFDRTVDAAIESYISDMQSHWGGSVKEIGRTQGAEGDAARTVRIRADRTNGESWFLRETFVRKARMLVVLQGGCRWTDRAAFAQAFDAITASLRFDADAGETEAVPD